MSIKNKIFKYERFFTLSLELNPTKWFHKPRWYRFKHEDHGSPVREGQGDFGPFSVFWYREPK